MPLEDGYGVVIGTLHDYFRDPVNEFGQYYHANAILGFTTSTRTRVTRLGVNGGRRTVSGKMVQP
jgi:hypothetical protein